MSTFIRTISKTRYNSIGFDVYENKDGSATIRPEKLGHDLPSKHWVKFDSLNAIEKFIESIDMTGVQLVFELQKRFL